MADTRIIKKYPNRRYYDSHNSRHVTLEDIHALVAQGNNIRVTESKTGEDITLQVLMQVILEHDAPKLSVFSVDLLHQVIQANSPVFAEFVDRYISGALHAFLRSQKQLEQYMRDNLGMMTGGVMPGGMGGGWPGMMGGPFAAPSWPVGAWAQPAPAPQEVSGTTADATTDREQAMQEKIDQLSSQMAELQRMMEKSRGESNGESSPTARE